MSRVTKRRLLYPVVCAAAIGTSIAALAFVGRSDATPPAPSIFGNAIVGEGRVSVLNRPVTPHDLASKRTRYLQASNSMFSAATDIRLGKEIGATKVFVAPGKSSGDVCLIVEGAIEDSSAVDCAARSLLVKGAIYLTKPDYETRTADVFVLVTDGVTSVDSATVQNNVAVLTGHVGQLITLTNRAGVVSTVDLGPQFD
jgi:hypothetical protein